MRKNKPKLNKIISGCLILAFISCQVITPAYAQAVFVPSSSLSGLPEAGTHVGLSSQFNPPNLRAVEINFQNLLEFNFIMDQGDFRGIRQKTIGKKILSEMSGDEKNQYFHDELKSEYGKIIKYFLASLTIPEDKMWVNLSPHEKNRIIPEKFSYTEMGRDLLAQDYLLKQITASLMDPENDTGKEFWKKIHIKAYEKYGTIDVPVDIFNKVWITPHKAVVYENGNTAYLVESRLRVMLEEDYKAMSRNTKYKAQNVLIEDKGAKGNEVKDKLSPKLDFQSSLIKEIILPELEHEINTGKHFAPLRQITNALILATWYKQKFRESLLGKIYVNQSKIDGIDLDDKKIKEKIYARYLESFKQGAFNYIKEEYDSLTQELIPRKYFSGGWNGSDYAQLTKVISDPTQLPGRFF